jgi:hypothetical protein
VHCNTIIVSESVNNYVVQGELGQGELDTKTGQIYWSTSPTIYDTVVSTKVRRDKHPYLDAGK